MGLSLDKAAALKSRKQQINKTNLDSSDITVDVSVRAPASKNLPSKNHHVPTTPRPPHTTFKLSALTTISTPVTTPTTDKSVKKDTTIPTLSSDMMLPDGSFESGDGEIIMETFTTEKYTTSKLEDEAYTKTDMFESTFDNILKNIFKYQDEKDLDLKKASPDTDKPILALNQLTKEASFEPSNSSNYTKEALVHSLPTTVDHTPLINESNSLTTVDKLPNSDYSDETILPTPSADDDLSFTLPSNTTLAQYIFGNTTLDDNYSNDLAFILNSTLPLDYLISNDTLYNEFMSIINETLSYDEIIKQANMSIDMALHETGDYQNLIDYISNMTAVLDTEANYTSPPEITAYHTTHGIKINTDDGNATTTQTTKTSAKKVAKNTSTTFAAKINTKPARSSTVNTRARVTDPARFEYADSSAPQYSAVQEKEREHEGHRHNYPQKTDFAAGDYYSNEDQDIERNSNNNQVTKPFKHSGFAPVNLDDSYKKNARHAGLSYLGFDFKHINRSPYTPKSENSEVAQLVNQKTIWSESTQKHVTSPAGYSCPGLFGYYGDAHNCKAFFICSWGVPYRFHCPTGTMWSSKESVCDWNRNVICHESK
ncbi:uncharacterized protein LOC126821401 isoform X2 [Patella vulgata]|nr:uncharacterized protein LOC126821401 isoform X2 [Patella vulgata]